MDAFSKIRIVCVFTYLLCFHMVQYCSAQNDDLRTTLSKEITFALMNLEKNNRVTQVFLLKLTLNEENSLLKTEVSDNVETAIKNQLINNLNVKIIQQKLTEIKPIKKNIIIPIVCLNLDQKQVTYNKLELFNIFNGQILNEQVHVEQLILLKVKTNH